jgi:lipooligosaccharide transport system permease protein
MWLDMFTLPRLGFGTLRVWYRDFFYFKKYLISSILWNFTEPILYILAFGYGLGFFVGSIDGVPYMVFLAPAILATTAMQGAVFESTYSSYTKLRVQKTYETIMMTPVSVEDVVAGEILWGASKAFFGVLGVMFIYLVIGMVHGALPWLALPVLFILAWCISAMSMVVTSFARDYDSFTYYFSLVVTPMGLLAGTYFPLEHFPKWAQTLALIMPLTHGVLVTRALFLGHWHNSLWINFIVLIIMSILFSNWAIRQTRRRLIY